MKLKEIFNTLWASCGECTGVTHYTIRNLNEQRWGKDEEKIWGAGAREGDGVPPEPQASSDSLTPVEDQAIIAYVERWKDHGFQLKKQSMVSQIASAYLKHHGTSDNGTSCHSGIFARNRDFYEQFKKSRLLEKGSSSKEDPALEDDRLCKFIDQFAAIRADHRLNDEHIHALSETGYATTIQKDRQPLNIRSRRASENREFASVIYCYPAQGKPLSPYVIFKSSNVRGPKKYENRVTISYNTTGWAEKAHALDWLNSVFEKETSPSGSRDRGQRRDRRQQRLLLVDSQFPMTAEFFVTCWERNVICLCLPKKGSEYLSPFENGIFDALDNLYAEHMKKQLRQKCPYTISPSQFATFIDRELGFPDRDTESKEAWFHTCLLPPSRSRLINRRTGDRIRSQTVEPNSPNRSRRRPITDETNDTEQITAGNNTEEVDDDITILVPQEQVPSPQSLQGSQPRERPAQEVPEEPEISGDSSDTAHNSEPDQSEQSSSEDETPDVTVPITPCRTPNRPKTPKSSRKLDVLPSSVMKLEEFQDCFDRYENATPAEKKRRREEVTLGYARCVWKLEETLQSQLQSKKSRTR
ncbi:uncharacterized protein PGRI_004910 [Penicillium griseofulvum]|uniref:DDE-1 domain-containing protein n=1 Tax=Penicillium patulum TaxID=5078 RepID=A0A135LWZ5_PENPA|nr:uncharacterized protein PGRI_004910 [Penicillium griseofulvum]KXG53441.1 hypothetical protein PGRI_004910 [Penicillium griseofulvum]